MKEQQQLALTAEPSLGSSWSDAAVAFHILKVSSLAEDHYDRQPLWAADLSCALICDLRLDNRSDLIRDLDLAAASLLPDSVILMEAWRRWGETCVDHLIGGFAFIVWNARTKTMFAARDVAGERSLFFVKNQKFLALATLVMPLRKLPDCDLGIDDDSAMRWLARLPTKGGETLFRGIYAIPHGHFLRATPNSFELRRYWHPYMAKPIRFKSDAEYEEGFRDVLRTATLARLRTTGNVAALVSSGLDSTSVAAMAAPLLADQGKRLTAITGVPRPDFDPLQAKVGFSDESEGPIELARMYPNIDPVRVDTSGKSLISVSERRSMATGHPVPNLINLLWLEKADQLCQNRGIKVILSGFAGNLTISYSDWMIFNHMFRHGQWSGLLRLAAKLRRRRLVGARYVIGFSLGTMLPRSLRRWLCDSSGLTDWDIYPIQQDLLQRSMQELSSAIDDPETLEHHRMDLYELMDSGIFSSGRAALFGVEPRDPTEDRRVYEYTYNIPPEQWLRKGHTRSLLRRAMKGILPDSIRMNYRLGFQGNDWHLTLREQLMEMQAEFDRIERSPVAARILDIDRLRGILSTFPEIGKPDDFSEATYHIALTRGLALGNFLRKFDSNVR